MLNKNITFIYSDSSEKNLFSPIYDEAKKRGYEVKMSNNPQEKCEIGFYCQHVNFPRNSKFSLIMLHDIIQQYGNWPDIWFKEHWSKYDIGILPNTIWTNNWNQCSQFFYTNPRIGVFEVGWPKADSIIKYKENIEKFCKEHNIDRNKKTVLYAPAWENDNKQDDFVQAVLDLDVNIIIKQYDYDPNKMPEIYKNVIEMKKKHENIKGVTILPPETNIFEAIAASDILVSEESSTMCEAAMMEIPAISVSNWLIPDTVPSRYPSTNYDFVIKTTKEELQNTIKEILNNYDKYKTQSINYAKNNFSNIGNTSKIIMDIIDDCINNNEIKYPKLTRKEKQKISFGKLIKTEFWAFSVYIYNKYFYKNKTITKLCKKIANLIRNKIN